MPDITQMQISLIVLQQTYSIWPSQLSGNQRLDLLFELIYSSFCWHAEQNLNIWIWFFFSEDLLLGKVCIIKQSDGGLSQCFIWFARFYNKSFNRHLLYVSLTVSGLSFACVLALWHVQVQNSAQRFVIVSKLNIMFPANGVHRCATGFEIRFLLFGGCVRTAVQSAATCIGPSKKNSILW